MDRALTGRLPAHGTFAPDVHVAYNFVLCHLIVGLAASTTRCLLSDEGAC